MRLEWRSIIVIAKHFNKLCAVRHEGTVANISAPESHSSLQLSNWALDSMTRGDFTFLNTCCVEQF